MKAAMVITLGFALAGSGCCRILDDLSEGGGSNERVDLGEGAYPAGNQTEPVSWDWKARSLDPPRYRAGFRMPGDTAEDLRGEWHAWGRKVKWRRVGENTSSWVAPPGWRGGRHCIYDTLVDQGESSVRAMTKRFAARIERENLNAEEAAKLVLTFVQSIKYRIPEEEPFGILPPSLVLKQKEGDCDSKSLLGHMMLRDLGIDSVLVSSKAHKHTMMGVALPSSGTTFTYKGRRYAFLEATAKGAPIGYINPKLLRPDDWRVDGMTYRAARMMRVEAEPAEAPPGEPPSKKPSTKKKARPKPPTDKKKPPSITDIIGGKIRIDR